MRAQVSTFTALSRRFLLIIAKQFCPLLWGREEGGGEGEREEGTSENTQ
jgi:hypothetical protein